MIYLDKKTIRLNYPISIRETRIISVVIQPIKKLSNRFFWGDCTSAVKEFPSLFTVKSTTTVATVWFIGFSVIGQFDLTVVPRHRNIQRQIGPDRFC